MRPSRILTVVCCGLLISAFTGMAPAQAAVATRITSVTVPAEPIDLDVTPDAKAVIRAHIIDPIGIQTGDPNEQLIGTTHTVTVHEGAPESGHDYVNVGHLIGGTPQNGDWEFDPFTVVRPDGNWETTMLNVLRLDGSQTLIPLRPLGFPLVFKVTGRMHAGMAVTPNQFQDQTITYGGSVTLRGAVAWYDDESNVRPAPGMPIRILLGDTDSPFPNGSDQLLTTTTTAADGTFTATVQPDRRAFHLFAEMAKGTDTKGIRLYEVNAYTGRVDVKFRLSVRSTPPRAKAGTIGAVEGSVAPVRTTENAYLQRYAAGRWAIVASAPIRSSGRYTLPVEQALGTFRYRVYKASDTDHTYAQTPAFTVTGL